jgi:hypothetical protein
MLCTVLYPIGALHRVRPLAGPALVLIVTIGWVALLGYVQLNYFEVVAVLKTRWSTPSLRQTAKLQDLP